MSDDLDLTPIKEEVRSVELDPEMGLLRIANLGTHVPQLIAEVERLRALRPKTTAAVLAHMNRADAAEEAIARVRAICDLVADLEHNHLEGCEGAPSCGMCVMYDVLRALDGEGGE